MMEVLSSSEGTEFFEIPEQFMSETSSTALSLQTSDMMITNERSCDMQNQIPNVYLEVEKRQCEPNIAKDPTSMHQIEINTDNIESIIYDSTHNKTNTNNFVTSQEHLDVHDSNNAEWYEEDVDLTKIFLCNTEGALDEINLGFNENLLFGGVDDPHTQSKGNETSEALNTLEQNDCLELNNNINCDKTISSSFGQADQHSNSSMIHSTEDIKELLTSSNTNVRSESKNDNISSKNPFNCQFCSKSFRYSSRLKRHLTTHQNKQYPCRICHKLFSRVDVMETHIARTHFKTHRQNIKKSIEKGCDTKEQNENENLVASNSSLSSIPESLFEKEQMHHYERQNETKHQSTLSVDVPQPLQNQTNLSLRISAENEMFRKKRHRNNLCLRCPVCPATLSSHHHLERHINAHENQMGKFECKFCGKKFEIKHRYQMHMRIHINERKFKCDECGQAFMQKEFLTRHKLTHTGEVPFRCDTCGKAFRQLVNLKQHKIRKHFNNKNNKAQHQHKPEDAINMKQCEFCNKSFMTTSELKNHLLYHMKERKHNCTLCSSKFLEKRHLDRHLRRCHSGGIKNFICNVCGKGFYERYELNYHWKTSLACSNHSSLLTCVENTNDITMTKLDSNVYG